MWNVIKQKTDAHLIEFVEFFQNFVFYNTVQAIFFKSMSWYEDASERWTG